MAIEMRLAGGLGNQLHQFAAGVAIAGNLGTSLNLYLPTINLGSNTKRTYELGNFEFGPLQLRYELVGKTKFWRGSVRKLASRLSIDLEKWLVSEPPSYLETGKSPLEQIRDIHSGASISGHFVSFEWAELARNFGFDPRVKEGLIGKKVRSLSEDIENLDVAVHLRFGDFRLMPDLFPIAKDDFIERALSEFKSCGRIWIFTDDLQSASKFCPETLKKAYRVLPNTDLSGLETFWMLGKFSKLVTGNSTFSTWAAFLSSVENVEVVTPTPHLYSGWIDGLPRAWKRVPINA